MVQGKLVPMRGRRQSHYHNLKGLYQSVIFLVDICLGCGYANFFPTLCPALFTLGHLLKQSAI